MSKIIGNTTATPTPRSDWNQVDETKADFILNKPGIVTISQDGLMSADDKSKLDGIEENATNTIDLVATQIENNEVSYTKDVPEKSTSYAVVNAVGGMTYKVNIGTEEEPEHILQHTSVSEVESVGANLIPFPYYEANKTQNGMTFTVNNDGGISVSGTPTAYTYFIVSLGVDISNLDSFVLSLQGAYTNLVITGNLLDKDGNKLLDSLGYGVPYKKADYPTASKVVIHVKRGNDNIPCTGTAYPMLNAGETALPYTPYVRNTLPIPDEVKALDGYGWGINESIYNYVDWEKKQFIKNVERLDLGTVAWKIYQERFYSIVSDKKESGDNFICDKYETKKSGLPSMNDLTITGNNSNRYVYIRDDGYTDITAFTAAMSGVMLYYELAEPVITDISHLLPDGFIKVQEHGTVTFKNEYNYDIPNEVTFYTSDSSNETIAVKTVVGDLIGHASSAERLVGDVGSETQPVYFKDGKPVATTISVQKQADWNQNDESAPDYIKNRTHWIDDDGTVHKLDNQYLDIVSEEEFLMWLTEMQLIDPVTSSSGEIYVSPNNEIYSL